MSFPAVAAISLSLLVIVIVLTEVPSCSSQRETEAALQRVFVEIKASQVEARMEKLRNQIDSNYSAGIAHLKGGKYGQALSSFKDVEEVNPNYKDLQKQLLLAKTLNQEAQRLNEEAQRKEKTSRARAFYAAALKQSRSETCSDLKNSEKSWNEALALDPLVKPKDSLDLKRIGEKLLSCPEGNSDLSIAIQIEKRRPVTLYVWIKNLSGNVKHANPNYFTLVTQNGESHSCSTATFRYEKPFLAVNLQPGTEASGIVVFETSERPRKLVYRELLGTQISREFP